MNRNSKKIRHKNYLNYHIPKKWIVEENDDCTIIYNEYGKGAFILSFYTFMEAREDFNKQVNSMGEKFAIDNEIRLETPFIHNQTNKNKTVLCSTGYATSDNEFFKIWIIAKYPKVIIATYNSKEKNEELDVIEKIVDSFQFHNI